MKFGSVFALLGLVVLIALGMISLTRSTEQDAPKAIPTVNTHEPDPSGGEGAEEGPTDLQPDTGADSSESSRAAVPEEESEPGAGTLRVLATDAITGQPVQRFWMKQDGMADVTASAKPRLSNPLNATVTLDSAEWDAEAPMDKRSFLVSSPRHTPKSVVLDRPRRMDETFSVKLLRAASIVGTVRDGSSGVLPSARVTLQYHGPAVEFTGEFGEPAPMPDSYQGPTLRLTDKNGEYAFSQLPPGVYRTNVELASALHASGPIYVRPGEWSLGHHWLDEHVRLTMTVTKPDGTAAVNTLLLLVKGETPLNTSLGEEVEIAATQYTNAEGRATLGPLSPGAYRLRIQSDDGVAAPIALEVTETSPSSLDFSAQLKLEKER